MIFQTGELSKAINLSRIETVKTSLNKDIEKLSRSEFLSWLPEYTTGLKQQITRNTTLDPTKKRERVERALEDFEYFKTTYFPHYFSLTGQCDLHDHLDKDVFPKIANSKNGSKYATAAPRGHAKTTECNIAIIWYILKESKHFILNIAASLELSELNIEAIKSELEFNENLKADFPEACGVGDVWKVGEFVTRNNIKVKGFGALQRIRGVKFGSFRPDLILIDDLENDININSRAQRDKQEAWLDEAITNLGDATGSMDTLYIGTILHKDSVLSRKLKLAYWNPKLFQAFICFPKRKDDLWQEYGQLYKQIGEDSAHLFYLKHQSLMDEGAVVLWDAIAIETLMRKWLENPKAFAKELQNNPLSDTQKFRREKITFYKRSQLPAKLATFGWCDPAGNKKRSDFCNFTILGVDYVNCVIYILESINRIIGGKTIISEIIRLQLLYRCKKFGVETNGGQFHLKNWLLTEAFNQGVQLPVKGVHNSRPKEERIEELELPIENGELLLHPDQVILINQLEDFPEGDHDDAPDGLHGCYRLAKGDKLKKTHTKRTLYINGLDPTYHRKR